MGRQCPLTRRAQRKKNLVSFVTFESCILGGNVDERYSRQLVIPEVGAVGQARLRQARVLVVGGGGLGSPVLLYLAAAGVGTLGVADGDHVSPSNLNRQILYKTEDVGRSKSLAAVQRARELNPEVKAIPYEMRLLRDNGPALVRQYDLVVDASDNLETKDLLNELCVAAARPLVWGAVERCEGQLGVVLPGRACRRCLFPRTPEPGTSPGGREPGANGKPTKGFRHFQRQHRQNIVDESIFLPRRTQTVGAGR